MDIVDTKIRMLDCHVSQFYEWLPWLDGNRDFDCGRMTQSERFAFLERRCLERNRGHAKLYQNQIHEQYGQMTESKYVESFELSEYGRQPVSGELTELLNLKRNGFYVVWGFSVRRIQPLLPCKRHFCEFRT
jgi:hypothetical protein